MKKEDMELLVLLLKEFKDKEGPGEMLRAYINGVIDALTVHPTIVQG
jgi:hypothetical protein